MSGHVGSPMAAALVNFAVGTVFLCSWSRPGAARSRALPQAERAPWWAWGAGILGGLYIAASAAFGPMIGGATFLALVVAGQMARRSRSITTGSLGFPVRPLDAWRVGGALLVIAGMVLLARR